MDVRKRASSGAVHGNNEAHSTMKRTMDLPKLLTVRHSHCKHWLEKMMALKLNTDEE